MRKTFLILATGCVLLATATADRPLASCPQSFVRDLANLILPGQTIKAPAIEKPAAIRDFGKVPVYFIPNAGQMDGPIAFYINGSDKAVYFTPEGVTYALHYGSDDSKQASGNRDVRQSGAIARKNDGKQESKRWVVKMDFLGANPDVKPQGMDKTGAKISYFRGKPEEWKAGLSAYSGIIYKNLWPGIDLVYIGQRDKLKYEFIVHPGADPATIKLAWRGAERIRVDEDGRLEIATPAGNFVDESPSAYQGIDGRRVNVEMDYALRESYESADKPGENTKSRSYSCGFAVGAYDKTRDLVLDPAMLVYCGFIGGAGDEYGYGIAVDGSGNAYVAGSTSSDQATFPVAVGPDLTHGGGSYDAYVAKVNAAGTALVYCGYIGGSENDWGRAITVDGSGNAYIAGDTYSPQATFPVTVGPDLTFNWTDDCFVAKVNATGTALVYCGYIGGSAYEYAYGIAVDGSGNAYVAGSTYSSQATFPVTVGPDLTYNGGNSDVFVAKVNASGTALVYCGYIGGSDSDYGLGVAVDGSGNAYVTGYTSSDQATFPVKVGPDLTFNGGLNDAFVAKIDASGSALVYCGYIGGAGPMKSVAKASPWTASTTLM